jgi:hypothetical protein
MDTSRSSHGARRMLVRLFGVLILACTAAFLPKVTSNLSESGIEGTIKIVIECAQLPGALVGLIIFRNVHGISLWLVEVTNVIFYSGLFYFLLRAWEHRTKS